MTHYQPPATLALHSARFSVAVVTICQRLHQQTPPSVVCPLYPLLWQYNGG